MTGRTIVITGGSDGIGAAAARQVAGKGHRIILVGRTAQKTAAVAQEIAAEHFVADFAKLDDVHRLAADIRGATDRIDVLANNAGIRAVAFHPGHVRTNLTSEANHRISRMIYQTPLARLVLISAEKGGSNLAHFIEGTPGRDWEPDRFYSQTAPATPRQTNRQIGDDALVDALWQRCSALVGLAVA